MRLIFSSPLMEESLPKDTTNELAEFVFNLSFMLSDKQETLKTNFFKSLVWSNSGKELWVYRFGSRRSNLLDYLKIKHIKWYSIFTGRWFKNNKSTVIKETSNLKGKRNANSIVGYICRKLLLNEGSISRNTNISFLNIW